MLTDRDLLASLRDAMKLGKPSLYLEGEHAFRILGLAERQATAERTEIRELGPNGELDEIVGNGPFHLEDLGHGWHLPIGAVSLNLGGDRRTRAVPLDYADWKAARTAINTASGVQPQKDTK